jgi:ribonuclease HII
VLALERELWSKNLRFLAGVDEVGRGPLAGPVVAAAVIFKEGTVVEGVRDSKKLSPGRREELFLDIVNNCHSYGIGMVEHDMIDHMNIRRATFAAMKLAIRNLSVVPDHVLVDGYAIPGLDIPQFAIIRGDDRSMSIAAASILAKVHRDRLMELYDTAFPNYGFARNKGYATPQHIEALHSYGPCRIHRRSFRPTRDMLKLQ